MGDFIEDKLSDLDDMEREFSKGHKDAKKYKQDVEKAHISLSKLIANIQLLISATDAVKQIKPADVKAFNGLSDSFMNRQVMTNFEVSELIDVIKQISTQIKASPKDSSTVNPSNYVNAVDKIMTNQAVPDAVKDYVSSISYETLNNIAVQISGQTKLIAEDREEIRRIISLIKDQKDVTFVVPTSKQLKELYQTDNLLSEYTDNKSKTTVEMLAKKRGKDVSQGSIAGSITYMEDMLGAKGSSDFLSDKIGDLFGIKNIKERLISSIGKSMKSVYSGVEKFLPEALKLDERRFYDLNKEIITVNEKIVSELDNDLARMSIKRDKATMKAKEQLQANKITEKEYEDLQNSIEKEFEEKSKNTNDRRTKSLATMEKSANSILSVDMSRMEENLYKNVMKNKEDLEKDLAERVEKGLISDNEVTKARDNFAKTETNLKGNFESSFKKGSAFDLEKYIKQTISSTIIGNDSLAEINKNTNSTTQAVNELLIHEKETAREQKSREDAKFDSKSGNTSKEASSSLISPDAPKKAEESDSGFGLGDLFGNGDGKKGRKGKAGKGILGKAGGMLGKAGGMLAKATPIGLAITAGMGLYDAVGGWGRAGENFDKKDGEETTTSEKVSSSLGSLASGLSFGLLDEKSTAQGINGFAGSVGNFFGFGDKTKDGTPKTEQEIMRDSKKAQNAEHKAEMQKDSEGMKYGEVKKISDTKVSGTVVKENDIISMDKNKMNQEPLKDISEQLAILAKKETNVHVTTGSNPAPIVSSTDKQSNDLGILFVNNGMFS